MNELKTFSQLSNDSSIVPAITTNILSSLINTILSTYFEAHTISKACVIKYNNSLKLYEKQCASIAYGQLVKTNLTVYHQCRLLLESINPSSFPDEIEFAMEQLQILAQSLTQNISDF